MGHVMGHCIGIDLGGTNLRAALYRDLDGDKDGGKPESLVQAAYRRLHQAKNSSSGAIIAQD